jgi:hypothetical protein
LVVHGKFNTAVLIITVIWIDKGDLRAYGFNVLIRKHRALYIKLDNNKIAKTIPMGADRFIDVNESGRAVGFEILLQKNYFGNHRCN